MHRLFIVWDEEYNLGIPIIDEQHRAIVSTINTYHYFVMNKMEGIALKPTLTTLGQYTKLHFTTEEEIFCQTEYPDKVKHKELHGNLIGNIIDIEAEVAQYKDSQNILNFLKKWWLNHIRVEDVKYAIYVIGPNSKKGGTF